MKNIRNVLMCASFLIALCAASADNPPVNAAVPVSLVPAAPIPLVAQKNDTNVPSHDVAPIPANATKVEPAAPKVEGNSTVVVPPASASNMTAANGTAVPAAGTPNATINTTDTNANKTITPVNPIAPPTVPLVNTTIAPNVTAAPALANVTAAPVTEKAPTAVPTPAPVHAISGRYFDGLSFIGGMVLAVGLLGIGRVALKIYKNRSDSPNYLTL